jgi:hypothetical protein
MTTLTRFMVQSYERARGGDLIADEPIKTDSPEEAVRLADERGAKSAGAVAYTWIGDMRNGESGRIVLLSRRGALPKYAAIALGIEEHAA